MTVAARLANETQRQSASGATRELDVERLAERGETRRMTALEAVSNPEQPRVVLLGDPGGGKSTFVNYLAFCLAMARLEPGAGWLEQLPGWTQGKLLPVRVVLRELIAWADAAPASRRRTDRRPARAAAPETGGAFQRGRNADAVL